MSLSKKKIQNYHQKVKLSPWQKLRESSRFRFYAEDSLPENERHKEDPHEKISVGKTGHKRGDTE